MDKTGKTFLTDADISASAAGVPPHGGRHPPLLEFGTAESREDGQDERAFGTLKPLWNFIDLTPDGRSDWNVGLNDHGPKEAKPALIAA